MTDYKYDFVKVRVRDGIAWTALNRPEKRNAMSPALHYEMDDALARPEFDHAAKAVADPVLPRHALYYACLGEPFDGKEAARIGMVNYAVPPEKLEAATTELAEKLMKKSAAVLRATKQAIRHVRTMDVAQAYDYLAEKGKAIKVADKEDSYNMGLRQFLDEKSYKPTFEPFRLATSEKRSKAEAKK